MILQDIINAIESGKFDEDLAEITDAIRGRKQETAYEKMGTLRVGQTVWLNEEARPHYIIGAKAKIRKINYKKVVIDLDRPAGRFHLGIRCPVGFLSSVEV